MPERRARPLRSLCLLALGLLATAAPALAGLQICDTTTPVTLIGMDTASGRMLFSLPPVAGGGPAWVVELDGAGRQAVAFPETLKGRFSGSVGPGPVIAAEPCGADCLQPVRWEEKGWKPLGEPLTVPTGTTLSATYDAAGKPWFLAHAPSKADGMIQAWAFRLQGREWKGQGGIAVQAVGQPQTLPYPQRDDSVVSGSGLFSASGGPLTWVVGLPTLPANRRGQLLPLTGTSAAYISADGVVYLSDNAGKSWRRSTWTPWGSDTTGMWRQGTEYGVDLPTTDHRGGLQLTWFDRRRPSEERVLLTRLTPKGEWVKLGDAASEVRTKNGEKLPVGQILVPKPELWILLSGCAGTADGSGLVLRSYEAGAITAARFVAIEAGSAVEGR